MAVEYVLLDGWTVPGYGLTATLSLKLKDDDASGDSSSTSKAKKGNKGKKLEVKTHIRFTDEDDLRELFTKAEAMSSGDGQLYTITNRTANTAGMRQGRFSGEVKAEPQESLAEWLVTFSLSEHKSVPERTEEREEKPQAVAPQNEGQAVAPPPQEEEKQELDWFQKKLQNLNEVLKS